MSQRIILLVSSSKIWYLIKHKICCYNVTHDYPAVLLVSANRHLCYYVIVQSNTRKHKKFIYFNRKLFGHAQLSIHKLIQVCVNNCINNLHLSTLDIIVHVNISLTCYRKRYLFQPRLEKNTEFGRLLSSFPHQQNSLHYPHSPDQE